MAEIIREELNALNEEFETVNRNLHKPGRNTLTDDVLEKVVGGLRFEVIDECGYWICNKCGRRFNLTDGLLADAHEQNCKG